MQPLTVAYVKTYTCGSCVGSAIIISLNRAVNINALNQMFGGSVCQISVTRFMHSVNAIM